MKGAKRDASILQRVSGGRQRPTRVAVTETGLLCALLPCPEGDQPEARSTGLKAEWRSGDRSPREMNEELRRTDGHCQSETIVSKLSDEYSLLELPRVACDRLTLCVVYRRTTPATR
jgi:hypothetical protein